jgi:hypothetical protein
MVFLFNMPHEVLCCRPGVSGEILLFCNVSSMDFGKGKPCQRFHQGVEREAAASKLEEEFGHQTDQGLDPGFLAVEP